MDFQRRELNHSERVDLLLQFLSGADRRRYPDRETLFWLPALIPRNISLFQGLLAVCTDGHTINLYSSVGIMDSTSKGTIVYPRPFKILFSTVPINAMVFTRDDTLALASTSNRTLTICSGILQPT